jgi:DNA helicase-2/ATP-dependent DNA helicase PcrA
MITKKFQMELSKLNASQREAVETIEGPVMVIAGPGTGKTQILAMRIANILAQTQIGAGNILALSFTNSGVWAMRKRLLEIIGPDSYKVHVHTFHSFCNEVIQTFPEKFLFSRNLEQINVLDQILTIRKILDESNFQKIKTLKAPYYYQGAILQSINSLKQENISPEKFRQIIQKELKSFELIDDLYHDKGPNQGQMKAKYIDQKDQLLKNLELAEAYKLYDQALKRNGEYDYADMILFVVKAFSHDQELLSYYQ